MKTVTITMEGGVIQHIESSEAGIKVIVKDFLDNNSFVESNPSIKYKENKFGDKYEETVWEF